MEPIWISRAGKRIEFNRSGQPMILNNNEYTIELLDSQGNIIGVWQRLLNFTPISPQQFAIQELQVFTI